MANFHSYLWWLNAHWLDGWVPNWFYAQMVKDLHVSWFHGFNVWWLNPVSYFLISLNPVNPSCFSLGEILIFYGFPVIFDGWSSWSLHFSNAWVLWVLPTKPCMATASPTASPAGPAPRKRGSAASTSCGGTVVLGWIRDQVWWEYNG